jgi:phosphate uptake regulator
VRRKIVKQGAATLTVSLPSSWTKKFDLKSGDEVEVEEKNKNLVLSTIKDFELGKIKINIDDINSSQVWGRLNGIYRKGFGEIEIYFKSKTVKDIKNNKNVKTVELLQNVVDRLIGIEIVRQGKNTVLLKEISDIKQEEFDNMLKRTFHSLKLMVDDCVDAAKKSDKDTLKNISQYSDLSINKLTNYCFRILSKKGHKEYSHTHYYFLIVHLLEKIGDSIAFVAKKNHMHKMNKDILDVMHKTGELIDLFNSAFHNSKKDNVLKFYKKRAEIKKEVDKISQNKKHFEVQVLSSIRSLANQASEALSAKLNITEKDY